MKKSKLSGKEDRYYIKRYMSVVAVLVIFLLMPITSALGKTIENTTFPMQQTRSEEWTEKAKLLASDGDVLSFFGMDISIDGEYAFIGASGDDDSGMFSGAVYVFKKTGTTWTEKQKLKASDGEENDGFGSSVSVDGDYAIIGRPDDDSPGAAYIFKNTDGTWVEEQILTASDGETWDEFGFSASLDGDYAIVGAQFDDDIGSAYIFKREGTTWTEEVKLVPSDGEFADYFGAAVAIQGDYAVIGAFGHEKQTGAVYIFKRENTTWKEDTILVASNGQTEDRFGVSVAIQDDRVVAGAIYHNEYKGTAYVFKQEEGRWVEEQELMASDAEMGQDFGQAIAIDDDCIFVGAPSGETLGSVYVFTYDGQTWTETQKITESDPTAMGLFGSCISLVGDTVMIGKYGENDFTGSAYVFSTESEEEHLNLEIIGGLGVSAIITNNGTSDLVNVSVLLHVEGGILGLINRTITDIVDIPANDSVTVSTGLFLGLGGITITASANEIEQTVQGTHFLLFSRILDTWTK